MKNIVRLGQSQFRKVLIDKYQKCIITDNDCIKELSASHIVPYAVTNNNDINNGLLLAEQIHRTFDIFYWTINPNTLKVEINRNVFNVGTIKNYENKRIKLELNQCIYNNLLWHYTRFKK